MINAQTKLTTKRTLSVQVTTEDDSFTLRYSFKHLPKLNTGVADAVQEAVLAEFDNAVYAAKQSLIQKLGELHDEENS